MIMKKNELEIFYKLDEKKYLVQKNKTIRDLLKKLHNAYDETDIQSLINKLIAWYWVKYSDGYLNSILQKSEVEGDTTIIEMMTFEQLKQRFGAKEREIFNIEELKDIYGDNIVIFWKYVLEMAGWGLIYDKKSNPRYGYYRTVKMFQEFNACFRWNLTTKVYDSVIEKDYSPDNEQIISLLEEKKKEKERKNKEKKKKKTLFRR